MKCPYRPITTVSNNTYTNSSTTTTDFAECYHTQCPWYIPKSTRNNKTTEEEFCQRCLTEHLKAQALSKTNNKT